MKKILIFAGTTEGRKLAERLAASKIIYTICVATEYGEIVLQENPYATIHRGRMDVQEMRELISQEKFAAVVDATHPYATVVTENIKEAVEGTETAYYRLRRAETGELEEENVIFFESHEACVNALKKSEGNILLTTGSKELAEYTISEDIKKRLYVRVLPALESIKLCMEQGICGKQILALQGPFSEELNRAIIRQYRITHLVTKKSGIVGGYPEKIHAAKKEGISVFVISNDKEDKGLSFGEICEKVEEICGKSLAVNSKLEIILAGIGMGNKGSLTREVSDAIARADILLGAGRMIEKYQPRIEKKPYYLAEQIVPYLKNLQKENALSEKIEVVILFSGDSGFYSGCRKLYQALENSIREDKLCATLRVMPGISSVSYLAAWTGESYQDAAIKSIHGREDAWKEEILSAVRYNKKTYILVSGVKDINEIGGLLVESGLDKCKMILGYRLSYPEQEILELSPEECCDMIRDGIYTCLIKNCHAQPKSVTHGISDSEFVRDKVPMTKEEVREVSICKMHLHQDSVVYDVGSGTGSLAIEMARLSDRIQVFAIEKKQEAISLIEKNKKKFQIHNLCVVEAEAPDRFNELPIPTHAFLGGSGGKMKEILEELYQMNSRMRIVINAISIETISEMKEILEKFPVEDEEIVQIQLSRSRTAGKYHLMQAENPVWICAFNFKPKEGKVRE